MTQNRLNGLAQLNRHHSTSYIPLADEVKDEYLQKNCRLMETSFQHHATFMNFVHLLAVANYTICQIHNYYYATVL